MSHDGNIADLRSFVDFHNGSPFSMEIGARHRAAYRQIEWVDVLFPAHQNGKVFGEGCERRSRLPACVVWKRKVWRTRGGNRPFRFPNSHRMPWSVPRTTVIPSLARS